MKRRTIKAWHFVGDTLRDGRPVPADGVTLKHDSDTVVMCAHGLHASLDPFDALKYAPGHVLCEVECGGLIVRGDDKLVCTERTIIRRMDFTEPMRYFARMQALSVVHLWDAPQVVLDYLMTGDESIRDAARDAAWDARDAAWAAARDAAWAARSAARSAAWDSDAWDADRGAARADFNSLVSECFA